MRKAHIIIIDDNPTIVECIRYVFKESPYVLQAQEDVSSRIDFDLTYAYDGVQGLEQIYEVRPDIAIVDINMPRMDGYQLIRCLRSDPRTADIPVIIISARTQEEDQEAGFLAGCDCYLVKPFKPSSIYYQTQALLRRSNQIVRKRDHLLLCFADVKMDIQMQVVYRGKDEILLTKREYNLLECFLRHPEEVLKRSFLQDCVWGTLSDVEPNSVDVYIGYLRKKLEAYGGSRLIQTRQGMGYILACSS